MAVIRLDVEGFELEALRGTVQRRICAGPGSAACFSSFCRRAGGHWSTTCESG